MAVRAKKPDRIKSIDLAFKGITGKFDLGPRVAIVGPSQSGKSSLLAGIMMAGTNKKTWGNVPDKLKADVLSAQNAVPFGNNGAHVTMEFMSGLEATWTGIIKGRNKTPTVEHELPERIASKFPQTEYMGQYVNGPQILARSVIYRFADPDDALAAYDGALGKLKKKDQRVIRPMLDGVSSIVDAWTKLANISRGQSQLINLDLKTADKLRATRQKLGFDGDDAADVVAELWNLNNRVQMLSIGKELVSRGDWGAVFMEDELPESFSDMLNTAVEELDDYGLNHRGAKEYALLSRQIREAEKSVDEKMPARAVIQNAAAVFSMALDGLLLKASTAFTERMKDFLPTPLSAALVPGGGGVRFGLRTSKKGPVYPMNGLCGYELSSLHMALPQAWATPGVKPIVLLDTKHLEADTAATRKMLSVMSKRVADKSVAQIVVTLHADRIKAIPDNFQVIELEG